MDTLFALLERFFPSLRTRAIGTIDTVIADASSISVRLRAEAAKIEATIQRGEAELQKLRDAMYKKEDAHNVTANALTDSQERALRVAENFEKLTQ